MRMRSWNPAPLFLLMTLFFIAANAAGAERLVDYVNPFVATGGDGFGVGSANPGPAAPFGLIKPGPDTTDGDLAPGFYHCAGYYYGDKHIRGFSHTRIHGIGAPDYGNIMLMPTIGAPENMKEEKNYRSEFSHKEESALPGYYSVMLKDTGIFVEITTSEHVAYHRYTFPESKNALVVLNASSTTGGSKPVETDVQVDQQNGLVTGWFEFDGSLTGRGGKHLKIFYVIQSKKPFQNTGVWQNNDFITGEKSAHGVSGGVVLGFNTNKDDILEFKVAISYISVEQALINLKTEGDEWDFNTLLARTQSAWESLLSRVVVQGGSEKHRRMFYTALYHSMQAPTLFTEANGYYMGFDQQPHKAEGFRYYSDMSMWDTFRTLHPLLTLILPEYQRDFVVSMIRMSEQGGYIPKWPAGTGYSNCMIGTPADVVIADTYLKGVRDFDVEEAYDSLRLTATEPTKPGSPYGGRDGILNYIKFGYLPADQHGGSVSKTLEYAFNDYALSQLAAALGKTDDAAMFLEHSKSYRNVWNPATEFFDGRNTDGTFITPGVDTAWRDVFTEGTAWQWLWFVPHDVDGLIALFGGRDAFYEKLDEFFKKSHKEPDTMMYDKYYWHGNEPDIHAAYMFLWAGRPDRTQEEVRWIIQKKYDDAPDGIDGNDDVGTLSAWYAFSSMGFFPIPATNRYYIGSPIFKESIIHLRNGKDFVVRANDVSPKNLYVQSAKLNGAPLVKPYFYHSDIEDGGELVLEMGPEPSEWGKEM